MGLLTTKYSKNICDNITNDKLKTYKNSLFSPNLRVSNIETKIGSHEYSCTLFKKTKDITFCPHATISAQPFPASKHNWMRANSGTC